jgi:flagellar M-ring protein FliF
VEPTASVAVKLRSTGGLNKNEIAAIRNLVATAVPGLKPQRVTIVDSRGALLAKGADQANDANAVSEDAEEFRNDYEKKTVSRIEQLLEQSVGLGKVKAEVHADIDFNRTIKNSEKYDPEGQVARSIQNVNEKETSQEKNGDSSVSVANQLPAAQASGGGSGTSSNLNKNRVEETTNFEISKETVNSIKEAGTVNRLTVAVMVDGIYTADKDGKQQYAPRSEEELKKLAELVQSAVGYDAARGDDVRVVSMPFAAPPADLFASSPLDWLKQDLNSIIQTLVLGGVAILAILLVIRPLVARAIEASELASKEDELEQAALLAAPSLAARLTDQSRSSDDEDDAPEEEMINIDRIQGKLRSSLYAKINDIIERNPDETAQIMRQWMNS